MRLPSLVVPLLALACGACTGLIVATDPTGPPPVVVDEGHGRGATAHLGIPPGHLPPPGECRIWYPDRPPGHQPRPGGCARLRHQLPPGAWLLYRPRHDQRHIVVNVCDERRAAVVIAIRTYEADTGRFVHEDQP